MIKIRLHILCSHGMINRLIMYVILNAGTSAHVKGELITMASAEEQRQAASWCTTGVDAYFDGKIGTIKAAPNAKAEVKLEWLNGGGRSGWVCAVRLRPLTTTERAQVRAVRQRMAQEKAAAEEKQRRQLQKKEAERQAKADPVAAMQAKYPKLRECAALVRLGLRATDTVRMYDIHMSANSLQ